MMRATFGARERRFAASCVTAAALVFAITSNLGVGNASTRATRASGAGQANVLVEPVSQKSLWAGTIDPALISALKDANIVQMIYAGLLKQEYDDNTKLFKVVP